MCEPTTLFIASTAISAGSSIMGGIAGNNAGKAEAYRYKTQEIQIATQASQEQRARADEFRQIEAQNSVAIAMSGLDPSSFDAIADANRRDAGEDMDRIGDQAEIQKGEARINAAEARSRGRQALMKGVIGAASTAVSGAHTYSMFKPPSSA